MSNYPDHSRRNVAVGPTRERSVPIPNLLHGMLPQGIHACSLTEIEQMFVNDYASQRRDTLWKKFGAYILWLKQAALFDKVYVDGSFTTDKPDPGDIDVLLEANLTVAQFNLKLQLDQSIVNYFHPSYTKPRFEVHPFLLLPGAHGQNILDLFQTLRVAQAQSLGLPPTSRKGILVFDL